jgi:hypothetical protein
MACTEAIPNLRPLVEIAKASAPAQTISCPGYNSNPVLKRLSHFFSLIKYFI